MILAAGLTPAWQQIVLLDTLRVGEVNRAREVHWCGSGKVLNVGIALHHLQASACTLALVGGPPKDGIEREFAAFDIRRRWVTSQAHTRVCTTLLDQRTSQTTEIVENAPAVTAEEIAAFQEAYALEASRSKVVVLTGSLPAGAPATLYRDLLARTPGKVVLDARGESLQAALECRPFVVKPNREELGQTVGHELLTDADLHAGMREINRRGAEWVLVSQGKDAMWASSATEMFRAVPPRVAVVNPIASGDCLAAALAVAISEGKSMPEAIRFGLAAASDNVGQLLPARLDRTRIAALAQTVQVESVASSA